MRRSWRCATRSRCWNGSWARPGCGSPPPTGRSWPPCCTGSHATCSAGSGCWCGRTRCCAGSAISWPAITRPDPAPGARGGPRTVSSIRQLVLRLARENPSWGYRRIHGELLVLGIKTAASTVWEILHDAGIDPAPERTSTTWADFLRSQADAMLACDFFETVTLGAPVCTSWRSSSTPPGGSGSWAQPLIPLPPGSPKPRGTSSWILRMQGAGRGS